MELVAELNLDNLIIKPPKQMKVNSPKSISVSEVWYKKEDGSIIKPIFQTPRLKIMYTARKFQDNNYYSYCLSLHNEDIDEDVACFYNLVTLIDEHILDTIKEKKWRVNQTFRSSLCRKNSNSDYYIRVKLLNETRIHDHLGSVMKPEDLTYGTYTDQYVGLDVIIYNTEGVIPIWTAHQIVANREEKIFLATCLLDVLYPNTTKLQAERAEREHQADREVPVKFNITPRGATKQCSPVKSALGMISLTELTSFKFKTKTAKPLMESL
jgi:hypothetical protein